MLPVPTNRAKAACETEKNAPAIPIKVHAIAPAIGIARNRLRENSASWSSRVAVLFDSVVFMKYSSTPRYDKNNFVRPVMSYADFEKDYRARIRRIQRGAI